MDIVLGVSIAPGTVRLVAIEGQDADGVTVEQEEFEVGAAGKAVDRVIDAIGGTREGVVEGGHRLSSTGVTWTNPADVAALRAAINASDLGDVMMVAPLLAAAALAQTVGDALAYERIAMLFVETASATLAVVEVGDGSIVDLHRRRITGTAAPAELATMVAGLDAGGSAADGVFIVGCGADIVALKPAIEAATSLRVTGPEEPDMALARGPRWPRRTRRCSRRRPRPWPTPWTRAPGNSALWPSVRATSTCGATPARAPVSAPTAPWPTTPRKTKTSGPRAGAAPCCWPAAPWQASPP
ncbi:hypothetical protein I550_5226 [Mycobacterium intracellulare 1956]|uniref:DUF7159 domain-containing protein n=1 Tax=Mycobacterium intracellulare 1956 TaxID=1299331 RepID=X8CDT2_MYCIT|nr:hypothetical protein I550_5226 [Mycobacterium intracellulare 1956]